MSQGIIGWKIAVGTNVGADVGVDVGIGVDVGVYVGVDVLGGQDEEVGVSVCDGKIVKKGLAVGLGEANVGVGISAGVIKGKGEGFLRFLTIPDWDMAYVAKAPAMIIKNSNPTTKTLAIAFSFKDCTPQGSALASRPKLEAYFETSGSVSNV